MPHLNCSNGNWLKTADFQLKNGFERRLWLIILPSSPTDVIDHSCDHMWLRVSKICFSNWTIHSSYFALAKHSKRAQNLEFNFSYIASGAILTRFSPRHIKLHFITCAFHRVCVWHTHSKMMNLRESNLHAENCCVSIPDERVARTGTTHAKWMQPNWNEKWLSCNQLNRRQSNPLIARLLFCFGHKITVMTAMDRMLFFSRLFEQWCD